MRRTTTCVVCGDCGTEGPEAGSVGEARELAASKGWLITGKTVLVDDYCPNCRVNHQLHPCAVSHDYSKTPSVALYVITPQGREQDAVYTCGMHVTQLMKEILAGGTKKLTIDKIASRR